MSEPNACPYCGNLITDPRILQSEVTIRSRCTKCGGVFEYIPGFGLFSTGDSAGVSASDGLQAVQDMGGASSTPAGNCTNGCIALCCACSIGVFFIWMMWALVVILS
ncbi:MAG: hypothetical protein HXY34_09355 [Candidatus Thorarchaeota archaeon]|nr:hypothetical protein [Candidatus Thorarchaeota archaeon]